MKISENWDAIYQNSRRIWSKSYDANTAVVVEKILADRTHEGLDIESATRVLNAILFSPEKTKIIQAVVSASSSLRGKLYGNKVYLMAPIEVSDFCSSECAFCGWRSSNHKIKRTRITKETFLAQAGYLMNLGIKHIEIAGGDDFFFVDELLPDLISDLRKLAIQMGHNIEISICTMSFSVEKYKMLAELGLNTVLTWQETYNPVEYHNFITSGPKACSIEQCPSGYMNRLESQARVARAGLQVGIGAMLGLSDNMAVDIIATILHAKQLVVMGLIKKPIIIGMPTLNTVASKNSTTSGRTAYFQHDHGDEYVAIAALYLLANPDNSVWIFPNCRVPLSVQAKAVKTAGFFSSTSVRLSPGGYLIDMLGSRKCAVQARRLLLGRNNSDFLITEQFEHHYHTHQEYIAEFKKHGLEAV